MANSTICSFSSVDPSVKSFLIQACILPCMGVFYGTNVKVIEVALNKILRHILIQPLSIVLLVSPPSPIIIVYHRFCKFLSRGFSSSSELVSKIFHESSLLAYTSTGYNMLYGNNHKKHYTHCDITKFISYVHILVFLPVLMFLSTLSLAPSHFSSLISPFLLILHLLVVCYIIIIMDFFVFHANGAVSEKIPQTFSLTNTSYTNSHIYTFYIRAQIQLTIH